MCTHNEPSTHTVSIGQVQRILQGVVARGLDIDPILQRVGIQPALLHAPKARVTQAQYARLIQHLRRLTRDELWWLCDTPLPIGSFTHICRHVIHQPTLAAAIQKGPRSFAYCSPPYSHDYSSITRSPKSISPIPANVRLLLIMPSVLFAFLVTD